MTIKISIILLTLLVALPASALPTAKITIKVIDQKGNPVEGAKTGIGFISPKGKGKGWGTNSSREHGLTDSNGLFIGKGSSQPYLSYSAKKDGYYDSGGSFKAFTGVSGIMGFRRYEPWNPTVDLELRKILNPIPMYAVRMVIGLPDGYPDIPVLGEFVGFDLTSNDWVAPHGIGTHKDLLFRVDIHRAINFSDHDVTFTIKFSNIGDGILEHIPDTKKGVSRLRLPHHAPEKGYVDTLIKRYKNTPGTQRIGVVGNPEENTNYFFRVRTKSDKDGNVIGGLYGKIYGQINLYNYTLEIKNRKAFMAFNYYLNPNNNDTNIEFDLKKNLFKTKRRSRVINP